MKGPMGHARDIELYSKRNGKALKGSKQKIDIIIFIF